VLSDDFHTSAGSTLIVRSDVVYEIDGFDESFARYQDPEFLIRVLKQGKLAYVPEALVEIHDTGMPSADAVHDADVHYRRTFAEDIEYLESNGVDVTGAHHYFLARLYLTEGRFRTGLRYLRSARRPGVRQLPGLALNVVSGVRKHA
jgi:GT2 family glycosyltransferase